MQDLALSLQVQFSMRTIQQPPQPPPYCGMFPIFARTYWNSVLNPFYTCVVKNTVGLASDITLVNVPKQS